MLPIRRTRLFGSSTRNSDNNNTGSSSSRTSSRQATVTARRVDPWNTNLRSADLPEALPSPDILNFCPELKCPLANVVLTNICDLQPWLLVVHPVTRERAERVGGCIVFDPSVPLTTTTTTDKKKNGGGDAASVTEWRYYCIVRCDDKVYGRAAYEPRQHRANPESTNSECASAAVCETHFCCLCCVAEATAKREHSSNDGSLQCCSAVECSNCVLAKGFSGTNSE